MSIREIPEFPELLKIWNRMTKECAKADGTPQDPSLFDKVRLADITSNILGVANRNEYVARYFQGENEVSPRVVVFGTSKHYDSKLTSILRTLSEEDAVSAIRLSGSSPQPEKVKQMKWHGLPYASALDYAAKKVISINFNDSDELLLQKNSIERNLIRYTNKSPETQKRLQSDIEEIRAEFAQNRQRSANVMVEGHREAVKKEGVIIQLVPLEDLYPFVRALDETSIPYVGFAPLLVEK